MKKLIQKISHNSDLYQSPFLNKKTASVTIQLHIVAKLWNVIKP